MSLFSFLFTLNLLPHLSHANFTLHPSDLQAILTVQKHMINGQPTIFPEPCSPMSGVHCHRRLLKGSHVLRVTRISIQSRFSNGFLSPAIGRLSELRELSLPNAFISGRIPRPIADCKKLEVLNLTNNRLSGEVPPELKSLLRLRVLDLSGNSFSGKLDFIEYLPRLESVSVAGNRFSGNVPTSVRSLRSLRVFNFSGNLFLIDQSPKRYTFTENSNVRNSNAVSPKSGSGSEAQAPSSIFSQSGKRTKNERKKIAGWVLGFFMGALAGGLSGMVFSILFKLLLVYIRGREKDTGPSIYSPMIKSAEDLAFLETDDGLTSLQMIGKGGCGEVYKAELPGSDGKLIAIKKIIQPQKDAADLASDEDSRLMNKKMRQIKSEINTVSKIRHRNLLPLLAHVSRADCHYLVYEFMKNGSLQDAMNDATDGKKALDWTVRIRVAHGVAAGLEYLHYNQSPRIIHRDLKPANVLLDDDMEARIADFGLAKAMPDANTHLTSSNVAGTVGYIAPEYHQTLKFTDKCDVYSFGVLLGVLVIGKLPSDEYFQHTTEIGLVKWMRNVMTSDDPRRAIDEKLAGTGFDEQMLLVLKIACFCTLDDPKQRPNSKDVRCMLAQIKP